MKSPITLLFTIAAFFTGCSPTPETETRIEAKQTRIKKAVRGDDLRYDIYITKEEEFSGFEQTITFERPEYFYQNDTLEEKSELVSMQVSMPTAWAVNKERKTSEGYHYALRRVGEGGIGVPTGNNGDLYVTVTIKK